MKSKIRVGFLVLCIMFVFTTLVEATLTMTIATFDDPAEDSTTELFTVDLTTDLITGGWDETGLSLDIPYSGQTLPDVIFTMTEVQITSETAPLKGTKTDGGVIMFFDPSDMVNPLIQIDFDSAWLTFYGYGGSDLLSGDNVTISGSEIGGATLTDEAFSFSFANQEALYGDWSNGYTATAAFTSSAIPEPATIFLLGIGAALMTLTRKKRLV